MSTITRSTRTYGTAGSDEFGIDDRWQGHHGYRMYFCCPEGEEMYIQAVNHSSVRWLGGGANPELNDGGSYRLVFHGQSLTATVFSGYPGTDVTHDDDVATIRHLKYLNGGYVGIWAGQGTELRVTCFAIVTGTQAGTQCG